VTSTGDAPRLRRDDDERQPRLPLAGAAFVLARGRRGELRADAELQRAVLEQRDVDQVEVAECRRATVAGERGRGDDRRGDAQDLPRAAELVRDRRAQQERVAPAVEVVHAVDVLVLEVDADLRCKRVVRLVHLLVRLAP